MAKLMLRKLVGSDGFVYHVSQFATNCLFGSKRRQHCACAKCSEWRDKKCSEYHAKRRRSKERAAARRAAK